MAWSNPEKNVKRINGARFPKIQLKKILTVLLIFAVCLELTGSLINCYNNTAQSPLSTEPALESVPAVKFVEMSNANFSILALSASDQVSSYAYMSLAVYRL